MTLELRFLGPPGARLDGAEVTLRGAKGWALLAYLVRTGRPVARHRLARLLFGDAADPEGALRWSLSQLRRDLRIGLVGDPVRLELTPGTRIDLDRLASGDASQALALPGIGEPFLDDLRIAASAEFERWLATERRHVAKLVADVHREAALACLARGDHERATALAQTVADHDPLDESAAALLVRSLRAAARLDEARAVASATAGRLRRELGVEPGGALWAALRPAPGGDRLASGPMAALAQLEAGETALAAGAVDTGLSALRAAVVAARAVGNPRLLARALVALGRALVHAVRDPDDDGVALLHEAVALLGADGDAVVIAAATRELGYVDLLHGRYERSWVWLARAREAATDPVARGWIDVYEGAGRDDVGHLTAARARLEAAATAGEVGGDARLAAYAATMLGRHHLLDDALPEATASLEDAMQLARSVDWTGLLPFPESMLADTCRRTHDLARAARLAEHATVLAEQVGDPCYAASAVRALGLVRTAAGDVEGGLTRLREGPAICGGVPGIYRWMHAWSVDAVADVTSRLDHPEAATWAARLDAVASPSGMTRFVERAAVYRTRGRSVTAP